MESTKPILAYFNATINKNTSIKNENSGTNAKIETASGTGYT